MKEKNVRTKGNYDWYTALRRKRKSEGERAACFLVFHCIPHTDHISRGFYNPTRPGFYLIGVYKTCKVCNDFCFCLSLHWNYFTISKYIFNPPLRTNDGDDYGGNLSFVVLGFKEDIKHCTNPFSVCNTLSFNEFSPKYIFLIL